MLLNPCNHKAHPTFVQNNLPRYVRKSSSLVFGFFYNVALMGSTIGDSTLFRHPSKSLLAHQDRYIYFDNRVWTNLRREHSTSPKSEYYVPSLLHLYSYKLDCLNQYKIGNKKYTTSMSFLMFCNFIFLISFWQLLYLHNNEFFQKDDRLFSEQAEISTDKRHM